MHYCNSAKHLQRLRLVDFDDLVEHGQSLSFGTLEGIAPNDGAVAAAFVDLADLVIEVIERLAGTARENNNALAAETGSSESGATEYTEAPPEPVVTEAPPDKELSL